MKIIEVAYKWAYGATLRHVTEMVILHHVGVAGSFAAEAVHNAHLANNWRGIAYHFFIRKDGSIYRGREENAKGGHSGAPYDAVSIGVCFEGNFETEQMPAAQVRAGKEVVAYLISKYNVPVYRHSSLKATACPGKNFPFNEIAYGDVMTDCESDGGVEGDLPEWAKKEFAEAVAAGITDGTNPMQHIPRYQAAIMGVCK